MRKSKRLVEAVSRFTNLPLNTVLGAPIIEISGYSRISIENHRGICAFEDDYIDIQCAGSMLRIRGSALDIRAMDASGIVISGSIFSVEYLF